MQNRLSQNSSLNSWSKYAQRDFLQFWPVVLILLSFWLTFYQLKFGTAVLGLGLLSLIVINWKSIARSNSFNLKALDVFIAVAIVLELIAYSRSSFEYNSRPALLFVFHAVVVFYYVRYAFTSPKLYRSLFWCMSAIGTYWGLVTIRRAFLKMAEISNHGFTDLSLFRNAYSPLVASNEWTLFLLLMLPFAMTLLLSSRRRIAAAIAGLVLAILSFCIVLGFSRGGYIALLLFFVVTSTGLLLFYRKYLPRALAGILFVAVLTGAGIGQQWSTVKTTIKMNETVSQKRSAESRWRMWEVGKSTLESDPWFGVGAYNFAFKYNIDHQRTFDEAPLGRVTSVATQLITEKGISGVLIPVSILLSLLILSWIFLISGKDVSGFNTVFIITSIAAVVAVCIRELTVSTLLFREFMFHMFCMLIALHVFAVEKHIKSIVVSRKMLLVISIPFLLLGGLILRHQVDKRLNLKDISRSKKAMTSKSFEESRIYLDRVAKRLPQHPVPQFHLATALAKCGQEDIVTWENMFNCEGSVDEARSHLVLAATLEPRDETIEFAAGWLDACSAQWPSALTHLNNAYRVDPTVAVYPLAIGIVYEKQGEIDSAVEYYAKALALDPDLYLSRFYTEFKVRLPLIERRVMALAKEYFDETGLEPISMARLGTLHFFEEDYPNAEDLLKMASATLPGMNRPYYYLGVIALNEGDTARAVSLWEKSIFLDPHDQIVNWQFGILAADMGLVQAKPMLKNAGSSRLNEPFLQKRWIFYPGMTPIRNTTLSESFMEYINPHVDQLEINEMLDKMSMAN